MEVIMDGFLYTDFTSASERVKFTSKVLSTARPRSSCSRLRYTVSFAQTALGFRKLVVSKCNS
eukprot:44084-Amphidinium_carterae.1